MALGPAWAALPVRSGGSCGLLVSRTSTFHDRWTETPWSAQRPKPRARGRRHRHDRGRHEVRAVCGLAFMRHGRVARSRLPNSNVAAWSSRAIPLGLPHSTPGWPGSGRCPRDENLADMSASLGRQGHQAFHCQPFLRGSFSDLMHAVMIQPRIARRLTGSRSHPSRCMKRRLFMAPSVLPMVSRMLSDAAAADALAACTLGFNLQMQGGWGVEFEGESGSLVMLRTPCLSPLPNLASQRQATCTRKCTHRSRGCGGGLDPAAHPTAPLPDED